MNDEAEDIRLLAGEYVLGTLDRERHNDVEKRMPREAGLADAVRVWESRLLPLAALADPITPSPALWRRIEKQIGGAALTPASTSQRNWWHSLTLWRTLAGSGFVAAALLLALLFEPPQTEPSAGFVVVLTSPQDKAPGWIVQTSGTGQLNLIPLRPTEVPAAKSLQFWTKADDWSGPKSLGLVQPGQSMQISLKQLPPLQANQLFEITLEPASGSPIGRPTGPILFIGRAVNTG